MLAYLLSLTVALGSLAIYLSAFLFPEVHRKNDFIWSGVGFFYALILWIFAPRITGGLLLGHLASVSLLVWFAWQTLSLRRQLVPELQQTPLPSLALIKVSFQDTITKLSVKENWTNLQAFIGNLFGTLKDKVQKKPGESVSKPVENSPKPPTLQDVVNVTTSSESDTQLQVTHEVSSDVSTVQEVVDVPTSSESDTQLQVTHEVSSDVSTSSESDTQLQVTHEVSSDVSTVQEVVDVPTSSESDTQLQVTHEVVNVPTSSESDTQLQVTHEVVNVPTSSESDTQLQVTHEVSSDVATVQEVVDVTTSSESDTKLQVTQVTNDVVNYDLSAVVEIAPVQDVVKVNESESSGESLIQDIPPHK